jgi:hypothetical protein
MAAEEARRATAKAKRFMMILKTGVYARWSTRCAAQVKDHNMNSVS